MPGVVASCRCECRKKTASSQSGVNRDSEGYSLEAFRDRLCDLCVHDFEGARNDRASRAQDEAQQAVALARELGFLNIAGETWEAFRRENLDLHFGTEHVVESDEAGGHMAKITIPPKFGLIPKVITHAVPNLRGETGTRKAIEFIHATPLEYLERWIAANEVFGDDVKITSVVQWADGQVSLAITQPQYHGEPASEREIERHFTDAGWRRIPDPAGQHRLFFNYAFQTLAIDALSRNCYLHDDELLPFDVILVRPDEEMELFLRLYD